MHQILRVLVLLAVGGAAMTAFSAAMVYWMEPARRIGRTLARALGAQPDVVAIGPNRGQGVGIRLDEAKVAIVRGFDDHGLMFELHELLGAELIFDGQVAARAMRGEARKPLDRIEPEVRRVMLRLVFDDVRDPDFDLELWSASDTPRAGWGSGEAVQAARRFFARVEAVVRR